MAGGVISFVVSTFQPVGGHLVVLLTYVMLGISIAPTTATIEPMPCIFPKEDKRV